MAMENRTTDYAGLPLCTAYCLDDVPPFESAVGMRLDTIDCDIRYVLLLWHIRVFLLFCVCTDDAPSALAGAAWWDWANAVLGWHVKAHGVAYDHKHLL